MFVYDFEVFKYDWLVVFKNVFTGEYVQIVNDERSLVNFYEENKTKLFIGFNNKRYDDLVFKTLLSGGSPQRTTKLIIEEKNILGVYRRYDINSFKLASIDVSQGLLMLSLKQVEGFLGLNIEETSVDFTINRRLTEDEIEETLKYCRHDVDATEYLFNVRTEFVKTKFGLIKEFNLSMFDSSRTDAQIVAKILDAYNVDYDDEFVPFDITKLNISIENTKITDFYTKQNVDYDNYLLVDIADVEHKLAFGGLHGAIPNFAFNGEIWVIDVASYYPSLMIHYDYISRAIPGRTKERYIKMYYDRLEMKKRGEKVKSNLYKLILNTTYGCMKDQYNKLYDPHNANNVCIAGQLMLIDLVEKLTPYCKLVQSNTDGIIVIPYDKENIKRVVSDWERRTKMNMEYEVATAIYQKDVNNYILEMEDGNVKLKGGYVRQSERNKRKGLRNSKSIIDDCVVEYFLKGTPPETIINNCNDLSKFQIITKTGGSYFQTMHVVNGELVQVNKVNRVYATKNESLGKLLKVKKEKGRLRYDSIANLPDHCYIANDNNFDISMLDKQFYIDRAYKRINDFKK